MIPNRSPRRFTMEDALDESFASGASSLPPAAIGVTVWLAALFFLVAIWSWRQLAPSLRLVPASILAILAESPAEPSIPVAETLPVLSSSEQLSPLFTPQVLRWSDRILGWASDHDLDPNLVATVMQIESCGHPGVASSAGAIGLFQVMPFHFEAGEDSSNPILMSMQRVGSPIYRAPWS